MNRNLFDLDNARNLLKKELIETFIPTGSFARLLAPKNQIIIGSRGSGKTALLKMISHDHLSQFDNELAKEVVANKTYIGIHISTKTKFSGGLKNKAWQNEQEQEQHFNWLMNVASCTAFLDTLKSCLTQYIPQKSERIDKELGIINKIKSLWFSEDEDVFTIDDVLSKIDEIVIKKPKKDLELKISGDINTINNIGISFNLDLFEPVMSAIKVTNRFLDFPEHTTWFICIDEIEILDEFHHRILNSHMRANSGNVFFKFTTLPYCHYTLETNLSVPLDIRHDVHYVYIDQDVSFQYRAIEASSNALKLFRKRAEISLPQYSKFSFNELFGKSSLLDARLINYDAVSKVKVTPLSNEQLSDAINQDETLKLFIKHVNENTKTKGLELLKNKRIRDFGDQFGRKLRALLHLKEYVEQHSGKQNMELYYGAKTVINIADGNPRKLIKIFKEMISYLEERGDGKYKKSGQSIIPFAIQNHVLATIAEQEINRYKIEVNFGDGLYEFVNLLGQFMHNYIHKNKLSVEQVSSIEISKTTDDINWRIVERAVQKGILYPNINISNPDDMPYKEGVFHLAFIFAPKFKLLPRKGDSRNLNTIMGTTQLKLNFDA